ncbi:hypothetical protein OKW46_004438 [Paraburkholderia sp. WSM4179]|uniref:hypothetical protein n=2 Tax=Burkholderiaceae TaxID=119060 RepID=UPI002473C50B|nr:hypothetical protein [Paraburkholderia sp. WSM4179]MDH6150513.1 hypothetical protein [Paraburkholderia sp. WSM4179]
MRRLPFLERNHGPVGDALDHADSPSRIPVSPVASYLVRAHAVSQGVAAAVRVARAQALRVDRGEPDLMHTTTADVLLALAEASAEMLAEQAERLAEWMEVAARADLGKARPHRPKARRLNA